LEPEQFRSFLDHVDLRKRFGVRDAVLFLFLYNTGARINEALQLRWGSLRLDRPWQVRLHGKGSKDRLCPLWKQTVELFRRLRGQNDCSPESAVFLNCRGEPLTRDGAAHLLRKHYEMARQTNRRLPEIRVHPHLLRHSCAVALLQAGIELIGIRDYLGHSSVATTSRYLQTNLAMKEKVLKRFWDRAGLQDKPRTTWRPSKGLFQFLQSL
jgi:integrase